PYPRTSPDHGTGFAIAGTGRANHSCMMAAFKLAAEVLANPNSNFCSGGL
ncbi:MAG: 4-hydroxythreonine-4-phosphate dehydrogenase PdxA, partial [Chthoniobacterales bacterium]